MTLSVALRKESVDRNRFMWNGMLQGKRSLSARRAWIEMTKSPTQTPATLVALRKESVDRNVFGVWLAHGFYGSLSARRAWIEMSVRLA